MTLTPPVNVDEVDAEIVVVAGCALGFVAPGQPPHVLHVDPDTETAKHGIQSDDLLLSIDGQDISQLDQDKVAALLRTAKSLVFERPAGAGGDEDGGQARPAEEAKAAEARAPTQAQRSRSRRGRRHRESKHADDRPPPGPPPAPDSAPPGYPPVQPPPWGVERGPGWPPMGSQLRGPPSGWMGNAPSPWPVHPGPPPAGYPPPRPPESWRGPYAAGPPPSHPPPQPRKGQRLERNENGGVSIVVMQVPPGVNKMDVLNEYFGRFGPVSSLQINQVRHEAIVTFSRMEDAEEALRYPVLNDPSIGLRPWRAKAGQRAPDDVPAEVSPTIVNTPVVPSIPIIASGNMTLESNRVLEAKRKREELQDRRKALLSSLTDQLKAVLARISDPQTSERNREQLQTILANIKDKINALTPPQKEQELAKRRLMPPARPMAPYQTKLDNRPRPATLLLSKLPAEMQGPDGEAQLRDALGESIDWIRDWSDDGCSCTVRFRDRRQAEAAVQGQKLWGYAARIQEEMPPQAPHPYRRKMPTPRFNQPRHMHKVYRPPRMAEDKVPGTPETEAFDSDIEDPEVLASMRPDATLQEELRTAMGVPEADDALAAVAGDAAPAEAAEEVAPLAAETTAPSEVQEPPEADEGASAADAAPAEEPPPAGAEGLEAPAAEEPPADAAPAAEAAAYPPPTSEAEPKTAEAPAPAAEVGEAAAPAEAREVP